MDGSSERSGSSEGSCSLGSWGVRCGCGSWRDDGCNLDFRAGNCVSEGAVLLEMISEGILFVVVAEVVLELMVWVVMAMAGNGAVVLTTLLVSCT